MSKFKELLAFLVLMDEKDVKVYSTKTESFRMNVIGHGHLLGRREMDNPFYIGGLSYESRRGTARSSIFFKSAKILSKSRYELMVNTGRRLLRPGVVGKRTPLVYSESGSIVKKIAYLPGGFGT